MCEPSAGECETEAGVARGLLFHLVNQGIAVLVQQILKRPGAHDHDGLVILGGSNETDNDVQGRQTASDDPSGHLVPVGVHPGGVSGLQGSALLPTPP